MNIVQNKILEVVKEKKALVTIYLTNGLQIKGVVTEFDENVILLEYEDKQQMLYKHAIMIMRPMKHLEFGDFGGAHS